MKKLARILKKNKYALLILLAGLVLLLIPIGRGADGEKSVEPSTETDIAAPLFDVQSEEKRLEELLTSIEGVGKAKTLLSAEGSVSRSLAGNGGEPLVMSGGSGGERVVELEYAYPAYTGAAVSCEGADSAAVRLEVVRAVSSFTGLKSDRITVLKMRQ